MLWHYEMQGELRVTEVELIWSAAGGENWGGRSEAAGYRLGCRVLGITTKV